MISVKEKLNEKFTGSFLGAAIGDALGWPQEVTANNTLENKYEKNLSEFKSWAKRSGGSYYSHEDFISAGHYSDDTQLLLATARSLYYGEQWSKHFGKIELPSWLLYERGGGGATKRASRSLSKGIPPWKITNNNIKEVTAYFNAGGNGVVMRILPHVYYCISENKNFYNQIIINGVYTHGHPRALLGALLYGKAVECLANNKTTLGYGDLIKEVLNQKEWSEIPKFKNFIEWINSANEVFGDYEKIWKETVTEIVEMLKFSLAALENGVLDNEQETLRELGCFNKRSLGSGTVTAVASIYLTSKYASNPSMGLIQSANLKGADTDTIASLVGGLLGSLHGKDWIDPKWLIVQDCKYLIELSSGLIEGSKSISQLKAETQMWSENHNKFVKDKLKQMNKTDCIDLGPFKRMELINIKQLKTNVRNLDVSQYNFLTNEGQSIFIKIFSKTQLEKNNFQSTKKQNEYTDKYRVILPSTLFYKLSELMPSKFVSKRGMNIVGEVVTWLESNGKNTDEKSIEDISISLVQKGLDLSIAKKIVYEIVESSEIR